MSKRTPDIQYPCVKCGHEQIMYLTPIHKAAPELLEALKAARAVLGSILGTQIESALIAEQITQIDAAITKAEGF